MKINKYYRLGALISEVRASRGIKQIALAAAAGIAETRLNAIERARVIGPALRCVQQIGSAMRLSDADIECLQEAGVLTPTEN